jgi:hypothetical protein
MQCLHVDDGSFLTSSGAGWLVTTDRSGLSPAVIQGGKTLETQCTAFDAELTAIQSSVG